MSEPIRKVVIVGGGTAGWMAAAVLGRAFGPLLDIELVESDQIGTVGVGEATIPQIRLLLALLGIEERDFLARVQGTIKLGIQFNGWAQPEDRYIHAFGTIGRALGLLEFHHYWLRERETQPERSLWDYSLNAVAAADDRFEIFDHFGDTGLSGLVRAYHFDAGLVANYLRGIAESAGVARSEGRIVDVRQRAEDGFIESVCLEDGRTIGGELFIDCSGFRGLLIEETLASGYEDWTHWLPCDRAVAVPSASVEPLTPYTQATARPAGWQWRIPLQQRIGNGHVFSSAHMDEDSATRLLLANLDGEPLAEPRLLRFTTGRRRDFWKRNCIALGLASGFLEPLESTSIHLVQSGLSRLLNLFPTRDFEARNIDEYNRQCRREFERVRDFIILHYYANARDEEFWTERREMPIPASLEHKVSLFRTTGRLYEDAEDLFKNVAWLQVLIGQRVYPQSWHPLAAVLSDAQLAKFMGDIRQVIAARARTFPAHAEWLRQNCPAIGDSA